MYAALNPSECQVFSVQVKVAKFKCGSIVRCHKLIIDCWIVADEGESGLLEDEYAASVATLQSLASTLDADCVLLRQSKVEKGLTGQYLVRRRVEQQDFLEIRLIFFK